MTEVSADEVTGVPEDDTGVREKTPLGKLVT